ncbi:HAD hydrolase-like protein [Modestobacter versicolor]|uniref:Haloacid dehalogenase n=1 Tax=Modestobacter versicolor TaxID=429133 RepID=A0A323V790_9ACTN|nr:HAD hydrolase-like protein [Modestobacter versicolor]MBB3676824.1 phosphoglycolate phosphatase [Modestobacter versicolor]PZA20544.1 haloacid dehalogenase [Modestobacter versicolor]
MKLHGTRSDAVAEGAGRLVLFDLDGTLVDSTPGIWASIRVAAAQLGLPEPTEGQLRSMVGPPLQDGFAGAFGLTGEDVGRAVAAYRAHYAAGAMFDAHVYPGIPELLAGLRAGGAVLAVATSKPEPFAVRILEHAGLLAAFDSVHGATMDGAVRHKDQVVAAALAAHPDGADPVLVGDRSHDVLGARAHGLPCIGAGWGPAPPGELAAAGAAAVVGTPAGVPAALAAIGGARR